MHFPAGKDDYFEREKSNWGLRDAPHPHPLIFLSGFFLLDGFPIIVHFLPCPFTIRVTLDSQFLRHSFGCTLTWIIWIITIDPSINHLVTMTNIILMSMLVHLRYAMPNPDHPPPSQGWILPFPPSAPPQGSLDSHKKCLKIGMIPLFVILKQIFGM